MYSWALISAVLSFFFFPQSKTLQRGRAKGGRDTERKYNLKRESTGINKGWIFFGREPAHGTIILPLSLWTTLAVSFVHGPWIYISFRQRHHKETEEHQFLPATSKRDVRPRRAEWLLCCTLQPGISKAFSFTFIAIMKEQGEHKRGLDSCPPSPLPAF